MDYLSRGSAPFSTELWQKITETVVKVARNRLVGRRFLAIHGPLGAGALSVAYDRGSVDEVFEDSIVATEGRSYVELPQIYEDFAIRWRDLEAAAQAGSPLDLSSVYAAANAISDKEDKLIFYGNKNHKIEGILNAKGVSKIALSDWKTGENAFTDVVAGICHLQQQGITGPYVLCVSPAIYVELQHIQPGTGMLEKDRIASQLSGLYSTPAIKGRQAVLLNAEPQNIDLAIGVDMAVGYLELKDLNHNCRILETILPRIKKPESIVVYE